MTSRGLAPELPSERATTVAAPPERWFFGNSANPTGVDLLRQAHARLPLRATTGASEPGHGFLHELHGRLLAAHETLRLHSDALKKAHADEQNLRKNASADPARHGIVEASTEQQAKFAWLIHGSKQQAAYIAKHGHGLPSFQNVTFRLP